MLEVLWAQASFTRTPPMLLPGHTILLLLLLQQQLLLKMTMHILVQLLSRCWKSLGRIPSPGTKAPAPWPPLYAAATPLFLPVDDQALTDLCSFCQVLEIGGSQASSRRKNQQAF
jgi:hypothetical protein